MVFAAFVSTLFAVIYTYEQMVGTSKSGCGSKLSTHSIHGDMYQHSIFPGDDLNNVDDLNKLSDDLNKLKVPGNNEVYITTSQVMWWMKSMLNQAEQQAGNDPRLRKKFLKLKFSTRPRFGTSYYLVLLCALCNFTCLYFVTAATRKLPPDSYTVAWIFV